MSVRQPYPVSSSLAIGSAIGSGTSGSVLFVDSSGNLAQDNADFNYASDALTVNTYKIKGSTIAIRKNLARTMAASSDSTIMIGTFTSTFGQGNLRISVTGGASGVSFGGQWLIPMSYGFTSSVYYIIQPIAGTAYPATTLLPIAVDYRANGSTNDIRLRNLTNAGYDVTVSFEYVGDAADTFVESSTTTGSVTAPTVVYQPLNWLGPNLNNSGAEVSKIYSINRPGTIGVSWAGLAEVYFGRWKTGASAEAHGRLDYCLKDGANTIDTVRVLSMQSNSRVQIGGTTPLADSVLHVRGTNTTDVVGIFQGVASQTGAILQGKGSTGNVQWSALSGGQWEFGTAPLGTFFGMLNVGGNIITNQGSIYVANSGGTPLGGFSTLGLASVATSLTFTQPTGGETGVIQMGASGRNVNGATGLSLTLIGNGSRSGGTNEPAGDLIISAGISTGTGTSVMIFKAPPVGASGSTDNTPIEVFRLSEKNLTFVEASNFIVGTSTGTKIGTATTQKLGFFGVAPVVQQTELTDELTTITFTAPGTPDYAVQNLTLTGYGFVTQDEGNTVLSVIANLQARVNELETKLVALGFLADAD